MLDNWETTIDHIRADSSSRDSILADSEFWRELVRRLIAIDPENHDDWVARCMWCGGRKDKWDYQEEELVLNHKYDCPYVLGTVATTASWASNLNEGS